MNLAEQEDLSLEQATFEVLEREFQEVLNELASDPSLEKFRLEYEKLHRVLKVSHENERKLLTKCQDLKSHINSNAEKVTEALRMTKKDSETISFLKSELEKTYKNLELTKEREQKSQEKIDSLDFQIKNLNNMIEQGNTLSSGQSNRVHELLIKKDELNKEKEMLNTMIMRVKDDLQMEQNRLEKLTVEKQQILEDIDKFKKEIKINEDIIQQDEERKKKTTEDLEQIKKNYEVARKDFEQLETDKKSLQRDLEKNQESYRKFTNDIDIMSKEKKLLQQDAQEHDWKLQEQYKENDSIEESNEDKKGKLNVLRQQNQSSNVQQQAFQKQIERLEHEIEDVKQSKIDAEQLRDLAKQSINELEKDTGKSKKLSQEAHSQIEELKRMRDILLKEVNRADTNNKKQQDELKMKEKLEKEKRNEIVGINIELERKRKKIANLEKEKEKYGIQAAQANAKYFHSLEEIKLKDNLISEFQKKNIETEAKLKQQQNLYEAVRSDRNLYSKNLTETQEEIAEIKRKYKIVSHQISQLKEEIDQKEKALCTEHLESKKKDKQIEEQFNIDLKFKKDIEERDKKINDFKKGIAKLHYIIKESEQQKQKLKEEYDLVVAERDILGTQLIRRNEEAQLLYEKIKINESYLAKGKAQYKDRIIDIQNLKEKIVAIMEDIKKLQHKANKIEELKNEMHNLQKDLIDEKLKVKALSEEIENPINVHRWRKLEATDSETYELMTKVHTLQKRLIAKTEEVTQKDDMIKQKENNLQELRDIMKRQPSIEEAKMISVYNESLKQKEVQMKAMQNELDMYQSQLKEYKFEIERLNTDQQNMKLKFYQQKKRELYEKDKTSEKPVTIQIHMPEKRFAGGGFNLVI